VVGARVVATVGAEVVGLRVVGEDVGAIGKAAQADSLLV
jgi:hypothetical protein